MNGPETAPSVRSGRPGRRVGSLSMGITLLLIGAALAASLWMDAKAYDMLLWVAPLVFILLGAELLISLKRTGNGDAVLSYDWVSVFFVGLLGAASLLFAAFTSTGIMEEIRHAVTATERSVYVDTAANEVPEGVTKIVVQSFEPLTVEEGDVRQIRLIGQIRYRSEEPLRQNEEDMVHVTVTGKTMYVMVGTAQHTGGRFSDDRIETNLTLLVPEGIEIENR